ncbi:antirestriction protein ArdA (plasmid) [Aneurinibacillus sp. Ricciae_BoGa-3]|uniref:antirestriction protein ArdA n=1 Tax=Aneurinibacillus sp. Ricciae_BoGa-3 TaxID=3022697 RepID=UPI0023428748|nr:antirestriction protein ArdA [Aneurinibacillus sp. Ricciae_BoGa-3]WCK56996.1 antirestriction protein ArdA [Aneurinibacillus sp. Ricciae_BoGa-3]
MNIQAKIFIGRVLSPADGEWFTFPMERTLLQNKLEVLHKGHEMMISDWQSALPIQIEEHDNPILVNEFIQSLKKYDEATLKLFLTAYWYREYHLTDTLNLLGQRNFKYYVDVTDTKSLGEAIVKAGELGMALRDYENLEQTSDTKRIRKQNVIDLSLVAHYLDFEQIGLDAECNGCRIHKSLGTAFMETTAS